ncbi:hypothetical protein EI94DRAFT_1809852 [Lactarius quietus]|nr:hypothetical protein EI94DRAFT_1809852 [Lactarius quietus]
MASPVARDTHLCVNGGIGEFTITAVSVSNSSNQQQLALGTAGLSSTGTVGDVATLSTVTDVLATVFSLSNGNTNAIGSDYSLVGISSGFDNDVNGKMAFTDPSDGVPSAPGNYCVSPADPTTPGYGVWSDFLTLNGVSNFALCEGIEDRVISNPQNSSFVQSAINFTTCFESDEEAHVKLSAFEERTGHVNGGVREALEIGKNSVKNNVENSGTIADGQDVTNFTGYLVDTAISRYSKDTIPKADFVLSLSGATITGNGYAIG